jgi:hypothetical protein
MKTTNPSHYKDALLQQQADKVVHQTDDDDGGSSPQQPSPPKNNGHLYKDTKLVQVSSCHVGHNEKATLVYRLCYRQTYHVIRTPN